MIHLADHKEDGTTYCVKNAPHQKGDLWIKVCGDTVKVMNPAGKHWRGKTFTVNEFIKEMKFIAR